MNCPVCKNVNLTMTDRQGIEIDYCPQCRGVWLDRGELDKIIERSGQTQGAPESRSSRPEKPEYQPHRTEYKHDDKHHDKKYHESGHKKKKHGFLGEIFDFD